ncbi:MAG TPA: SelB C-terminal domain-containing protein [Chthoniobacterales bacterium]|nr:SelB C-terminal domain-containing protein [Chthoniobacterales bacterium]
MNDKHFMLATAGHVDHGKSALVKALTGTDPDRLPEEKARGITIDLGFAHLQLSVAPSALNKCQSGPPIGRTRPVAGSDQPLTFSIGIIDVPGHEDFVRNMIAGVGSIDLALLAVAANEGWMPQTEEHLQILCYLGVKRLIVALTKSDIAELDKVRDQIREQLRDTPFADAPIIPTSVRTGTGLEELKSALAHEFAALPAPRDIGKARLFVDRAFILQGIGTVVTGTLIDGAFRVGDDVFVQPGNASARIRSLQTHGRNVDLVQPGTRTAINLPDLKIGTEVKRGDVIFSNRAFEPASKLQVLLIRSARLQRATPIKSGASGFVHHGTTRVLGKVIFPRADSLGTEKSAVAELRLDAPLLAFVGDRLIVRDGSGRHTVAGGLVFNLEGFRSNQERALLASRAAGPDDVDLAVWTEIARGDVLEPARLLERSRFSAGEIAVALKRLAHHGEIFLTDNVAAKMLVWRELRGRVAELIEAVHKTHPERRGLELNDLRAGLGSISAAVFDALLLDLCQSEFVRSGSKIARASHHASLPPGLKVAADKVRAGLAAKPFDPPGRKEVAKDQPRQQALRFLIEQGEIIEIGEEIVLLRESLDKIRVAVSDFISRNGPATASQLREKLGSSRRVVIPLLEYLDRIGVTQRTGDLRKLRDPKSTTAAGS